MGITVCFTGHRPQHFAFGNDERHPDCIMIKRLLEQIIDWLINEKGATHFITGMAQGVDTWAAEIVLSRRARNKEITLEAAIPCADQAQKWARHAIMRYDSIRSRCDKVTCLNEKYLPGCMMQRNKYMVDNSDAVVSVWNGKDGGTGKTVRYAIDKGKSIFNVNPITREVDMNLEKKIDYVSEAD